MSTDPSQKPGNVPWSCEAEQSVLGVFAPIKI